MNSPYFHPGSWLRPLLLLIALACPLAAANNYFVHNLVSDLPGAADQVDDQLVNPWDFTAFSVCMPVGSPSCKPPDVSSVLIANNGNGTVSQYTPIPGTVENQSYPYRLHGVRGIMGSYALPQQGTNGLTSGLLFCTEDGTIAGLAVFPPTFVTTLVDNSKSGAIYKGCTKRDLPQSDGVPYYYAANFGGGSIDVWDAKLNAVQTAGAFVNPAIPAGFAPFNIQAIDGRIYVTYARQDAAKCNDVPAAGNGYVAAFDFSGKLLNNLVTQLTLNSPWGLAIAPAAFGDFADALLVGNSGDGRINAFDAATGAWMGALADTQGKPIAIAGLHAFNFGGGGATGDVSTLYFTAGIGGPNGEPLGAHGVFGSIQAAPFSPAGGVMNGGDFSAAIAPNTWVTVKGGSLSATTRSLPAKLDGVGVTVNGEPAFVSYISPTQINFLVPADLAPGPVEIRTANNGLMSGPIAATLANACKGITRRR
jgi:uncharacterized protein (TIGR03118 family)